jgi:anti-sigma regulatory factor (Ser/Thr protein kinase)
MSSRSQSSEIREFILDHVEDYPRDITRLTSEKFGITRQAVNRHLDFLVDEGLIESSGKTRDRRYTLKVHEASGILGLDEKRDEDFEWRNHVEPLLSGLSENVLRICNHGFTEILNNAIDHSEGAKVTFSVKRTAKRVEIVIDDDGVGIFEKIRRRFNFDDHRQAMIELAKGKLTTDEKRHSGEGIFFTSRMFDEFLIRSSHLVFGHERVEDDWVLEQATTSQGTGVRMSISTESTRTAKEVFDRFADLESEDYAFTKTHFPLALARFGKEYLVSRSQARRVLARFEDFKEVILDFQGIDEIGQAFADEIFRVYACEHPEVQLIPVNQNARVGQMIKRAIAARK